MKYNQQVLIKLETIVWADGNVEIGLQTNENVNVLGRQNCRLTEDERLKLLILIEGKLQEVAAENAPVHGNAIVTQQPSSIGVTQQPSAIEDDGFLCGQCGHWHQHGTFCDGAVQRKPQKKLPARKAAKKKSSPFQGLQ